MCCKRGPEPRIRAAVRLLEVGLLASRTRYAFLAASVLGAACHVAGSRASHREEVPADSTRLRQLRESVTQVLQVPTCVDRSQCRVMPLGAKPCGGPWSYLIYSTATTDSARLAAAVTKYTSYQTDLNRKLGLVSDCQFVPPPQVDCVSGQCATSAGRLNGN
jgi:hypothetical protein